MAKLLKRQRSQTCVLRFDHSQAETVLANIKEGLAEHTKSLNASRALISNQKDEVKKETAESKLERANCNANTERMQEGKRRRTKHEFEDGKYDERDEFAIEVHKRRLANENNLKFEAERLESERTRYDDECRRFSDEEAQLLQMTSDNTAEEKAVVASQELIEQLEAAIREDETSRAAKMKEYLETCNAIVARQTDRLRTYKEIKGIQTERANTCALKLQEAKASMTKLVALDEASQARLELADARSDALQRQSQAQSDTEARIFYDNAKLTTSREKEAEDGKAAGEALEAINKFVLSIRPTMNSGMKEKSEQVRHLQDTWKQSKKDHSLMNAFTKKYSKEAISLAGMDKIPDHDAEFAHTLRSPYELMFKQDEQESKAFFHPISAALLKEGDTFSVLRSSQDDLAVWVQKVRDSVRDEAKSRKDEHEHEQAQLRARAEKEQIKEREIKAIEADLDKAAVTFANIQSDLKTTREGLTSIETVHAAITKLAAVAEKLEAQQAKSVRRVARIMETPETEAPAAKMVKKQAEVAGQTAAAKLKFEAQLHESQAGLDRSRQMKEKLEKQMETFQEAATKTLQDLKTRVESAEVGVGKGKAVDTKDEWIVSQLAALGEIGKKVAGFAAQTPAITSDAKAALRNFGAWAKATESEIKQQEKNIETVGQLAEALKKEKQAIAQKEDDHADWRAEYEERLAEIKKGISVTATNCRSVVRAATKAGTLCDAKKIQDQVATGEGLIASISKDGAKVAEAAASGGGDEEANLAASSEISAAFDDLRVAYVQYNRDAKRSLSSAAANKASAEKELVTVSEGLKKCQSELKSFSAELAKFPSCAAWESDMEAQNKKIKDNMDKLGEIDETGLESSVAGYSGVVSKLEETAKQVKEDYAAHKKAVEDAKKALAE